ncbi:hypothetical protein KBB76_00100 [Candidatus Saccharibacteria bacterium]|jgi:hypothetical protein|nr:hypothetical protein [Candidatus Saccharibacteria bacterium]HOR23137.1 hypothetical protein [Candidatus Saccharibacteria bacterium]HPW47969.1 hypothetical protein [Candidatus Saccharibacteria bacterium]
MKKHNQNGVAGLHILLILIIVAMVGAIGWYVYDVNKKSNKSYNSAIKTNQDTPKLKRKTSSNVIPRPAKSAKTTAEPATTAPPQKYDNYLSITEWGVKIPTNNHYMGYRWSVTDSEDNLVSVFITDNTNGLAKNVGCARGDVQGVYLYKDQQYDYHNNDEESVTLDTNLNVGGHVYYIYKSICQGKVSPNVDSLVKKIGLMSTK